MAYALVLFLHILTFTAAYFLGGIATYAAYRLRDARTREEAAATLATLQRLGKLFPLAVVLLLLTGATLAHWSWSFTDGWVIAGILGVIAIGVNGGAVIGARERALHAVLETHVPGPLNEDALAALPDQHWLVAEALNTAIATGVVLVMVLKAPLLSSLAIVMAFAAGTLALASLRRPSPHTVTPDRAESAIY
jgi:hypothetical protein